MAADLKNKKVAFLFTEGVEQVELTEPLKAVEAAGADTTLVSLETGDVQMFNHLDKGDTIDAELRRGDADAAAFDGLVLPGGVANPDALRTDAGAVEFVRDFFDAAQAGRGDLPRSVDAGRGRRRPRPHAHLVAEPPDRPAQRRRRVGRRGGPRRQRPRHQPQARRPPGVHREGGRGDRRGQHDGQTANGRQSLPRRVGLI